MQSGLGFNNNPTAHQFESRYKKMLIRHEIKHLNGNCFSQDQTVQLFAGKPSHLQIDMSHVSLSKLLNRDPASVDHDYTDAPPYIPNISQLKEAGISYIAGYVIYMAKKKILCDICQDALVDEKKRTWSNLALVMRKDNGSLFYPMQDVIAVCLETECVILQLLHGYSNQALNRPQSRCCGPRLASLWPVRREI